MARRLDDLDRNLAAELQIKADRSNEQIATRLSVSRSTVHRRIVELKAAGVITGVIAVVSPRHARRDVLVLVTATLSSIEEEGLAPFERWLAASADVQSAYLLPEEPAMVLALRLSHLDQIEAKLEVLRRENSIVTGTTARVASRTIKQTLYLPLDDLDGRI
jgi:DNA-binding Lrp family transcriptional regulator